MLSLARYNTLLSRRITLRSRMPYFVVFGILFLVSILVPVAALSEMSAENVPKYWLASAYSYVMCSALLLGGRHANAAIVLPRHLSPFPLSPGFLFKYLLACLIVDLNSLLFVVPLGILLIGVGANSPVACLASVPFVALLFLMIEVWMLDVYLLFQRQISDHPNALFIVFTAMYFGWIGGVSTDGLFERLCKLPVLSLVGAPVVAAMKSHWTIVFLYLLLMTALTIVGLLLGRRLSVREKVFE